MAVKLSKDQLRRIIRETVRRKLDSLDEPSERAVIDEGAGEDFDSLVEWMNMVNKK